MATATSREGMRLLLAFSLALAVAVVALSPVQAGNATDVWRRLHRPLHLPRLAASEVCPVSSVARGVNWGPINIFGGSGIGPGPVYPGLGSTGGRVNVTPDSQYGGPWLGGKLFWYVSRATAAPR